MTISDFDPNNFGRVYVEPPFLLHFQFTKKKSVYRYALVEEIHIDNIKPRTKQKKDELDLTQEQIWKTYG